MRKQQALQADGPLDASTFAETLFLDNVTARIAASAFGRWWTPAAGARVLAHSRRPAQGTLGHLRSAARAERVTLAILSRTPQEAADCCASLADRFAWIVNVVDATDAHARAGDGSTVIVPRPLSGNFAAQRNRAQAAAKTPWVLHLDTDETIDSAMVDILDHMTECADEAGLDAIGIPRRNMVAGQLTDLYPDTQYRLVRRAVRFEGRVHERPDACNDWPRTTVALAGALTHHLSKSKVCARQARYDALGQLADRRTEANALLRCFEG